MNKKNMTKLLMILNLFVLASCIQTKGNAPSLGATSNNSTNTGGGGGGTTTPAACGAGGDCRMFITTTTFANGIFGANASAALTAADNYCNTDANKPSSGTYKALIANSLRAPGTNWVLYANQAYVRKDGTTAIGTTTGGAIFYGTLTNPVVAAGTDASWMTGIEIDTNGNWSGADTIQNCNDFTTLSQTKYFAYGGPSSNVENHFGYSANNLQDVHCNLVGQSSVSSDNPHLLCVEQ